MNSTQSTTSSKNPFKWLLAPIAVPAVLLYKLGKALSDRAYSGWARALCNGLIGFGLAGLAAFLTAVFVGWTHGYTVLLWFPASCLAWLGTMFIAWPAAYLGVVKPIYDCVHGFLKWTDRVAKDKVKTALDSLIALVELLPGSRALWDFVQDKNLKPDQPRKGRWVKGLVEFLAGVACLGLASAAGYCAYNFVTPLLPASLGLAVPALAGLAAFFSFWIPIRILFQLLEHAELSFAGPALTAAGTYAAHGYIATAVGSLGLSPLFVWPALALAFILGLAYVYPGIHGLLKSGLVKRLLDGLKYLVEHTYDDDDREYRKFFGQVVTIPAAIAVGALAYLALSFYGIFPLAGCIAVALVVAVLNYLAIGESAGDAPISVFVGLLCSAGASVAAIFTPHATISAWLFWSGVVLTAVLVFTVLYPALYLLIRIATRSWLAKPLGDALGSLNDSACKIARKVKDWWEKQVIERTYDDDTPYRKFFGHAVNAAVLAVGIWQAVPLLTGWLGWPLWALVSGLAVLGFLVYMILGRVLLGVGPVAFGFAASGALFAHSVYELYLRAPGHWWLAGIIGLAAAGFCFTVVVPAVLVIVRVPANALIRPWLSPILAGIYDFCWKYFERVWDVFVSVCKAIWNHFLGPIFGWLFSIIGWVYRACADVWNSLFGRK